MKSFVQSCIVLSVIALSFTSCEEVMVPIPEFVPSDSERVVLLEDLTGVACSNCPKASSELDRLEGLFPDQVVAVGIHGDLLAAPLEDKSKYDFRNPKATALENFHQPFLGKPAGLINRVHFDGEEFAAVDVIENWQTYIEQELALDQDVAISIDMDFDEDARVVDLDVNVTPLADEQGVFNISVFVLESGIIDYQKDAFTVIPDYEHNHVLRDMLTVATGDALAENFVNLQSINKKYTYTIPDEFKSDKMDIVVSVHRNNPDNKTVMQSAKVKLKS